VRGLRLSQARRRPGGGPARSWVDGSSARALPVDARRDMKIETNAVHEKYNHVPSEARRDMFQVPWPLGQGALKV